METQYNSVNKNPLFTHFSLLLQEKLKIQNFENKSVENLVYLNVTLNLFSPTLVYFVNYSRIEHMLGENSSENNFNFFIDEFVDTGVIWTWITESFPTLIDDARKLLLAYFDELKEIKSNLKIDKKDLIRKKIVSKNATISNISFKGDFHLNKAVALVSFDNNEKVLYKPKQLTNEILVNDFISQMNDFSKGEVTNKTLSILNRQTYGWVEYIEHKPLKTIEEAREYYYRLGTLLAVSYILGLSDMHFENLISYGSYPIFVDEEVLFSNNLVNLKFLLDSTQIINDEITNSIIATGLLPIKDKNSMFNGDTSGFMGGTFQTTRRELVNSNRDDIKFVRKSVRIKQTKHLPDYRGTEILPTDYIPSIKSGFEFYYIKIKEQIKYVENFVLSKAEATQTRVLLRNTMEYSTLLSTIKSPRYIQKRSVLLEKLRNFSKDRELPFVESEIHQLKSLSIPYFQQKFNEKSITDGQDNTIALSKISPKKIFLKKLNKLSEFDLNNQLSMIDFTLQSMENLRQNSKKPFNEFDSFKEILNTAITSLKKLVETHAVFGKDKSVNWMNLTVGEFDEIEFQAMNLEIYNGISGIAIPFIKLYENENDSIAKKILASINTVVSLLILRNAEYTFDDFSLLNRKLGILLTQRKIKTVLGSKNLFETDKFIKGTLDKICAINIEYDDILAGYAGIVVGIYQNIENANVTYRKELNFVLNKILQNMHCQNSKSACWFPRNGVQLSYASYAHGNSGIMTALLIGYILTKSEKYLSIFTKAWNYEKTLRNENGWTDLRKKSKNSSPYWCHGSAGILISRTQWLTLNKEYSIFKKDQLEEIFKEIDIALNSIIQKGLKINNFSLCHGVMGSLVAINNYIKEFPNKELELLVRRTMLNVCEYGLKYNWLCGFGDKYYSYGLMTGISGILDALLTIKYRTDSILNLKI
ncbi:type 2 lantipeptide synthetase LanM family protein [Leuconostoc gelidum subsp. gasicomitatum]|uniref:type 2 lanthipeptide synthetase LanM family protein n=1 Tax=Leuconostoc gasicomitatum TaxID=115778 RepID=UPI001CC4F956|nr:type 2 lanthipeptide synthetase LanM family protein [Leuconostoc gasicomitatum]MBZ5952547.1 type 2 lantipeptide synthetase LanM family protein [Leuconostoc gasicomitatum]